ncbi:hypothetical protein PTTW11_11104 [Pyrenophora teres f. teres]|uniref:Uncharacterized protein n=1 Tax=Pyrenophora teres f. teres TaxID=97479 RepID=A0A6S6WGD9_9PLEO|nr:hypothetical protein PTTW11_11104 [Pyrenophora teres f. teres]
MAIELQPGATLEAAPVNISSCHACYAPALPQKNCGSGLQGMLVELCDGSHWKFVKALSHVKYQLDGLPPFEARQVFECVCTKDPNNCHPGVQEAVAKVKYQVKGSYDTRALYLRDAWRCRDICEETFDDEDFNKALEHNKYHARLFEMATAPVVTPRVSTIKEMKALTIFRNENCWSAPHLISYWEGSVPEGVDKHAIAGGYMKIMFMNKLPGDTLDRETFLEKTEETREDIRRAFKAALMEIWKYRLDPEDNALRNILWDEKEHKCYIVDFEDYAVLEWVPDPEIAWNDRRYGYWDLAEEFQKH